MSAPALTLAQIEKLGPCENRMNELRAVLPKRRRITAAEARELGVAVDDLLWVTIAAAQHDADVRQRLSLFAADCAAHVLHIYECVGTSVAPRRAIEAARAYARGKIHDAARAAARDAASEAAMDIVSEAAWAAAWAARAASTAAWVAVAAARDAAAAAAEDATWAAEKAWQFDRLVARLSDPEPEDWPLPERSEA